MTTLPNMNQPSPTRANRTHKSAASLVKKNVCSLCDVLVFALNTAIQVVEYFYANDEKRQKYAGFFNKYVPHGIFSYTAMWDKNRDSIRGACNLVFLADVKSTAFNDAVMRLLEDMPAISEFLNDVSNTFIFRDAYIDGRHITMINSEIKGNLTDVLKNTFESFKGFIWSLNTKNRVLNGNVGKNRHQYMCYRVNHGVLKFSSSKTNISIHSSRRTGSLINIDVTKFFDSFTLDKMITHGYFFKSYLINANFMCVSHKLAKYPELDSSNKQNMLLINRLFVSVVPFFLHNGKMPTGAVYSSLLSNFLFSFIDKEIYNYIYRLQCATGSSMRYTRYVDDITISSQHQTTENGANILSIDTVKTVEKILNAYGFYLNYDKTKIFSSKQTKEVNGLKYGGADHIPLSVASDYKYELSQEFDRAGASRTKLTSSQLGKLAYIKSVNQVQAAFCASHYLKHYALTPNEFRGRRHDSIHDYRRVIENFLINKEFPYDIFMLTSMG